MWIGPVRRWSSGLGGGLGGGLGVGVGAPPYRLRVMGNITRIIHEVASTQAGAVAWRQLLAEGVTEREVWCAVASGRLRTAGHGTYIANGSPATRWQQLWVAHLRAGESSVVSHWSAAEQYGLDGVRPSEPMVTIPHRRGSSPVGVIARRTRRSTESDIRRIDGLPFTSPARTVVDLAGECSVGRLAVILDSAHFGGLARYPEVGEVLLRVGGRGRRGSGTLAGLLDGRCGDPLSASQLEHHLGELMRLVGLRIGADALRQHPLPSIGAVSGTVDVFLPAPQVIIEADGRRWHQRQADMKRDRERDFAAAQVGVLTIRFLHEHLANDLFGCADGLRRVIASRLSSELGRSTYALGR